MKPLNSSFKNMFLVLSSITLIAGFILSYVYSQTKEKILIAQEEKSQESIKQVLSLPYNNNPFESVVTYADEEENLALFPAFQDSLFQGAAVKSFSKRGYSGKVWIMIGFTQKGEILKINVLEHKETPGLGTKMDLDEFKGQFIGKNPETYHLKVKKDGGDVDAITAATISSRAFSDAVERAHRIFIQYKKEKGLL